MTFVVNVYMMMMVEILISYWFLCVVFKCVQMCVGVYASSIPNIFGIKNSDIVFSLYLKNGEIYSPVPVYTFQAIQFSAIQIYTNIENNSTKCLANQFHFHTYDGILLHLAYAIKSIESIQFIGHIIYTRVSPPTTHIHIYIYVLW